MCKPDLWLHPKGRHANVRRRGRRDNKEIGRLVGRGLSHPKGNLIATWPDLYVSLVPGIRYVVPHITRRTPEARCLVEAGDPLPHIDFISIGYAHRVEAKEATYLCVVRVKIVCKTRKMGRNSVSERTTADKGITHSNQRQWRDCRFLRSGIALLEYSG